jgi:outer membrane cobalamin receptor
VFPLIVAFLLSVAPGAQPAPASGPSGVVVDALGGAIPDADVLLVVSGRRAGEVHTDREGRFEFPGNVDPADVELIVAAAGFSPATSRAAGDGRDLRIALEPAPFFDAVNVTSSRSDVPKLDPTATTNVLTGSDLLATGAMTLDDALKTVPGFTLFRRTSSAVSNPTAQGITLRGLGGTGSSRSLVLADGVPLNDAFGGWVYWDKVPQAAIDRVEVLRGSSSDLYGADAVGGVVQVLTSRPARPTARGILEGGQLGTGRLSLFGGDAVGGWSYSAGGEWFSTDGYVNVSDHQDPGIAPRGPIDTKAGSTHRSGLASLAYHAQNGWKFEADGNVFSEDRQNGTPAVTNATASRYVAGQVSGAVGRSLLAAGIYGGTQGYDQAYSAVSADRTSEDLNRLQYVPTRVVGFDVQWVRPVAQHLILVGAESKFIRGETDETQLTRGSVVATTEAGGTQRVGSAFVQDTFTATDRLTIVAGAHGDGWHTESQNTPYQKTLASFNPRISAAYRIANGVSIRGAAYGGFRAPTLNELYRGFRSGNTQTNPNQALEPERLKGGDVGLLIGQGSVSARVTAFWNVLDDAITNITLSTTPQLITKLRANADQIRSNGVEIEADWRPLKPLVFGFTSGLISAHYAGDTALRDNRVPQVPSYNVGAQARYASRAWTASGVLRVTGPQFEDDLNAFTLRRATVVDAMGSRALGRRASAYVAVENVFDSEYDVGRTPILTIGMPRAARVGLQLNLP